MVPSVCVQPASVNTQDWQVQDPSHCKRNPSCTRGTWNPGASPLGSSMKYSHASTCSSPTPVKTLRSYLQSLTPSFYRGRMHRHIHGGDWPASAKTALGSWATRTPAKHLYTCPKWSAASYGTSPMPQTTLQCGWEKESWPLQGRDLGSGAGSTIESWVKVGKPVHKLGKELLGFIFQNLSFALWTTTDSSEIWKRALESGRPGLLFSNYVDLREDTLWSLSFSTCNVGITIHTPRKTMKSQRPARATLYDLARCYERVVFQDALINN